MRRWSLIIGAGSYVLVAIAACFYSVTNPVQALLGGLLLVPICIAHATTFMYVYRRIDEEEKAAAKMPLSSAPGVEGTPWARNPGYTRDGES